MVLWVTVSGAGCLFSVDLTGMLQELMLFFIIYLDRCPITNTIRCCIYLMDSSLTDLYPTKEVLRDLAKKIKETTLLSMA